jgi:hypothetical protein
MLGNKDECFLCRYLYGHCNTRSLHTHHIFEGGTSGRRKMSDKYDLTVKLCPMHHNASSDSVHARPNGTNDLILKRMAQEYYEANIGSREDFIRDFIKSYL